MPPEAPDALVGSIVDGKYQIAERIGAGGMGTVYKAIHISLGAPRALKVMRRELAGDPALAARFRTEARLAEHLRHPCLVALYDFGQMGDGGWYIVSEFVEGATLAALLQRRTKHFSANDVAELMGQVADGLAFAHRKGIVHRDISPDNIMLAAGEDGRVLAKLLDFGIAKDTQHSPIDAATGLGWNMGKVGFSSPEQVGFLPAGEAVDARCDVFSLAAVAYLMLCGRLPWRQDSVQAYTHDLLLRPEVDLVAEIRVHAPPPWRDLFVSAFARARAERISSMSTLKERMAAASQSTPVEGVGDSIAFRSDMLRAPYRNDGGNPLATRTLGAPEPANPGRPAGNPSSPTPPTPPPSLASSLPSPELGPLVAPAGRGPAPVLVPSAILAADMASFLWDGEPEASIPPPQRVPPKPQTRRRLVLLDDDETLREVLPGLLAGPDLEVAAGPWRGDPATFVLAQEPDLVLVDAGDIDDRTAEGLHRFVRQPGLDRVPCVLFSSADEWSLRVLARRTGAAGYLGKEALAGDIGAAVRRFLAPSPPISG